MPPTRRLPSTIREIRDDEVERRAETARFIAAVARGLADSAMGRVVSDDELGRELEAVLGAETR